MRKTCILVSGLFVTVANCSDESLTSAIGQIELALCDRLPACDCDILEPPAVIEFGSPEWDPIEQTGGTVRRSMLIRNVNQPRKLTVRNIEVVAKDGKPNGFGITGVQWIESEADDADVENHDIAASALVLADENYGEIFLAFRPTSASEHEAILRINSDSATSPSWEITLRGGGGEASACVPSGSCGEGAEIDFGTHNDDEIGYDGAAGLPLALGTENIVVTNESTNELFFTATLTNDGIPEGPGEVPGARGVFFLADIGCTTVAPGSTANIPVEYRPSTAGEHVGELLIKGVGAPMRISLRGRVIGAHVCFRTEDDLPLDSTLQFGDAPEYQTASNAEPEVRRIWVQNCGYQEDLELTGAELLSGMSPDFGSTALPWTNPGAIMPGAEIEVPVTLTPTSSQLSGVTGRMLFHSNDARMPTGFINLVGFLGLPEVCLLAASPSPVDFGWVAGDDANQGIVCVSPGFPPGCGVKISREKQVTLINVGQRRCSDVNIGPISGTSASKFTIVEPDPNGADFVLEPGESSQPVTVLFTDDPRETPTNFGADLEFSSPQNLTTNASVLLKVKAGGDPACAIGFHPVTGPTAFCQQDQLAFGNVNYGLAKTIQMQVKNIGSEDCTVQNVRKQSGTAAAFSFPTTPFNIPVGQFHTLPVTFTAPLPTGDPFEEFPFGCGFGPFGGTNGLQLDYTSASMNWETANLAFTGKGKPPAIDVIPSEIDFGDVTVGCCSARERVAIYNSGANTLYITGVDVAGDPSDFANTQPGNTSIGNGGSTEFYVQFCASAEGPASDQVQITGHDDNNNDEFFSVSVTGNGVLDSTGIDQFQQPDRPMVDVLFVVDDSGSMGDEQDDLAANFDAFIGRALDLNTDYHLGVTNTDGETEWSGRLHACSAGPEGKFIVDYQPDAQQETQFRCNVKTSEPSDGRPSTDSKESALQAARAAFEYQNADWNVNFYREDAKLYIILVTDETDQSDGTADLYVDYFKNLKGIGNPDLLNLSAITGPYPDGCATAEENEMDYNAVMAVGGQFRSICSADWTDLLDSLGLDVFNARRQFPLSRPATPATIEVRKCSGACPPDPSTCPIVPQGGTNGWTFDASVNAVTFNGTSIPGAGECIWITYIAICYQPGQG